MPTDKSRAEYMAARRAKLKEALEPVIEEKAPPTRPKTMEEPIKDAADPRIARRTPGSGYKALPGDDWVSKLTQQQRDDILNHPAIKTAKRS